jgi:hypothetical protein
MADACPSEETSERLTELRAVVGLNAANGEGDAPQKTRQSHTHGSAGALDKHCGGQEPTTVVDEGELEATLGQVKQVHLRPLTGQSFRVALPMWFGPATTGDKGAGATENPVDTGEAAGNEASLLEVGVKPLYPQAKLEMGLADDIQNMTGESRRTTAWPPGAVHQGLPVVALPGCPPAGEGGVRYLSCLTEPAGAYPWVPTTQFLKRGDVGGSCLDGPRCASFVHVGPPVGF